MDSNTSITVVAVALIAAIVTFVLTGHITAALLFATPLIWFVLGIV